MRSPAAPHAAVVGLAGTRLTPEERQLLTALPPAGVILFRRNCADRAQLAGLVDELRSLVDGRPLAVFVDQEGGRVQRLAPPQWRSLPPARAIGGLALMDRASGRDAAWLLGRLIAHDLREVGIDVACAPVLDVAAPGMTEAIGSRSFGADPTLVAELAGTCLDGLAAGGVAGVIKHVPGHGRALLDSHLSLPVVTAIRAELAVADLVPFGRLRNAPFAMTAHVVFTDLDPERAATLSRRVIADVIRGELGIQGLLLSDDLAMHALVGEPGERARMALEAGCDLALYCTGRIEETEAVLAAAPALAPSLVARLEGVLARASIEPFDAALGQKRLETLLAGTWA